MKQQPFDTVEVRENIQLTGNYEGKTGYYYQDENGDLVLMDGSIASFGSKTISTDYTLLEEDNGKIIGVDSTTPITITILTGLPDGFRCDFIQKNTGYIDYVGESGISVKNVNQLYRSNGQYSGNSIMTDDGLLFILGGDLTEITTTANP